MTHRLPLLVVLLAMCAVAGAAEKRPADPSAAPDAVYRFPLLTIPKLANAPKIDGTIDKAEWAGAAQSAPFVHWRGDLNGLVGENLSCYWIGYTNDALFIAWRFDRPPFALTPRANATPDPDNAAVWSDDKIELFVRAPDEKGGVGYQFVVNAKGVWADRYNSNIAWTKPWARAARATDRGWEGEVSIPFSSMDHATPKPGEMWSILMLNNPLTPANDILISSLIHEWGAAMVTEYGYIRFGDENTPVVRVLDAGPVGAKEAGMTLEIAGGRAAANVKVEAGLFAGKPGSKGIQAEVSIEDAGGTIVPRKVDLNFFEACEQITAAKTIGVLSPVAKIDQAVAIQPDQAQRFPIRGEVPYGGHVLVYRVTDAQSGQLIAGGATPFQQRPLFDVALENYLLVGKGLKVTASYIRMTEVNDKCRVLAELIDPKTKTIVSKFDEPAKPAQGRTIQILPTPQRFDATYDVHTRVLAPDGKTVLAEDTRSTTLPPQPVWLDNKIGVTDDPLPGWTPIELSDNDSTAKVVLRNYVLDDSGLPKSITSREKALLKSPLALTLGDATPKWTARKLESKGPGKVVWTSSATQGDVKLDLKSTLEYDGLITYDLTLSPASGNSAQVKDLSLRVPYRADLATKVRRASGDRSFEFVNDKPLKEFFPMMTVGDFDSGLTWYCEWDRYWQIGKKPVASMEETADGTLDWRVNFIGQEGSTLTAPVTITFALQAMPVRELDTKYQYDQRHLYTGTPVMVPRNATIDDLVDTDLRYTLSGNTTPEQGSVAARIAANPYGRFFLIGQGPDAIGAAYARAFWENYRMLFYLFENSETQLWMGKGFDVGKVKFLAKMFDVMREDGWSDVALTWKRDGDQVALTYATFDAAGKVQSAAASYPWERWQKAYATNELIIGGGRTVAVDQVVMSDQIIPPQPLLDAVRAKADTLGKPYTVVDSIDHIRFYRGKFITEPKLISAGKGGIAGSKYWGALVKEVDGRPDREDLLANRPISNRAVLLPSKQDDDVFSIGRWQNVKYLFPDFEQFHNMVGYYGQNYIDNPAAVASYYQPIIDKGFRPMMYVTFGAHPTYDKNVSPFMDELSLKPTGLVYTAKYPSLGTPARDYVAWQLKKSIDEYKIRCFHLDGTLNGRNPDNDPFNGNGYFDADGKIHPRWYYYGERDLAKRMRWLLHSYVPKTTGDPEGLILLGHGARNVPMIAGFVDITMSGEGGFFYQSGWEKLTPPEDYSDMVAFRMGVPHQTLTKGQSEHKFSPNFTFMYMLLVNGSLRHSAYMNNPAGWHIAPDATAPDIYNINGPYNPYFAKSNVGEESNCTSLWWMLADDMHLRDATFVPFFRVNEYAAFGTESLRGALHFNSGKNALLIVANFTADDQPQAKVTIDLAKIGLAGKPLTCFDAFTDDDYKLDPDGTVTLALPSKGYRLVRIEPK